MGKKRQENKKMAPRSLWREKVWQEVLQACEEKEHVMSRVQTGRRAEEKRKETPLLLEWRVKRGVANREEKNGIRCWRREGRNKECQKRNENAATLRPNRDILKIVHDLRTTDEEAPSTMARGGPHREYPRKEKPKKKKKKKRVTARMY